MRPLTLGVLREAAEARDYQVLADWAWWCPRRKPYTRRFFEPYVWRDFNVLMAREKGAAAPPPADTDDDPWASISKNVWDIAGDLAYAYKWDWRAIWALPLGQAVRFMRDAAWNRACDGVARAGDAGRGDGKMPARPSAAVVPLVRNDVSVLALATERLAAMAKQPSGG